MSSPMQVSDFIVDVSAHEAYELRLFDDNTVMVTPGLLHGSHFWANVQFREVLQLTQARAGTLCNLEFEWWDWRECHRVIVEYKMMQRHMPRGCAGEN